MIVMEEESVETQIQERTVAFEESKAIATACERENLRTTSLLRETPPSLPHAIT